MAFKYLTGAEKRWRGVYVPDLVALVKAAVKFPNGQAKMFLSERPHDRVLLSQASSMFGANETQSRHGDSSP